MKQQRVFLFFLNWLAFVGVCIGLSACASSLTLGSYSSFGFDFRKDKQDAVILDYHYGNAECFDQPAEFILKEGKELYFQSMGNFQCRIDFVYVKWKDRTTGNVYEDNVNLRNRLPRNIDGQEVYLMIKGSQLFVYLINVHERRLSTVPPIGPSMYSPYKVTTIYPDQTK